MNEAKEQEGLLPLGKFVLFSVYIVGKGRGLGSGGTNRRYEFEIA